MRWLDWKRTLALTGAFLSAAGCGGGAGISEVGNNGGGNSGGNQGGNQGGSSSGGNGNAGTGAVLDPGGDSGGTNGGGLDPDSACVADSRQGRIVPVDLYFMVDASGSTRCPVPDVDGCEVDPGAPYSDVTRWSEQSSALKAFFASPDSAGLGAGIAFFPRSGQGGLFCDPEDYAMPDAEIAELPGAVAGLSAAIDAAQQGGNTPTYPALQGAIQHAQAWAADNPEHQPVVVYATDGYPRGCGNSNSIANAAMAAEAAYNGDPSIRTYVLGVGPNLTDLNQIALAGGTDQAFFVDTGQDVAAQLAAALNDIRESVLVDCTYIIPDPPPGQELDLNRVNVRYTDGAGNETTIPRDPSDSDCNEGWQYAQNDTQVVLCGNACEAVKADPNARVDVLFGCVTVVE